MKNTRIYIAGHEGMVGSSIYDELSEDKFTNILTATHSELDLTRQLDVEKFIKKNKPEIVIIAAAKVGGILANDNFSAEFIYQNIMIAINIINSCFVAGINKIIYLGSSCIYPKFTDQPVSEDKLLTGKVEPTNEAYAIAKIAGIKLCQFYNKQYGTNYITLMPTNTYGPKDNFNLENGHVISALINKFHHAKINSLTHIDVWGSGNQSREFIYVKDIATSINYILKKMIQNDIQDIIHKGLINIGTSEEVTIKHLAYLIKDTVKFDGDIYFDQSKPDGTIRRVLNSRIINELGWKPSYNLKEGLRLTYEWYLESVNSRKN